MCISCIFFCIFCILQTIYSKIIKTCILLANFAYCFAYLLHILLIDYDCILCIFYILYPIFCILLCLLFYIFRVLFFLTYSAYFAYDIAYSLHFFCIFSILSIMHILHICCIFYISFAYGMASIFCMYYFAYWIHITSNLHIMLHVMHIIKHVCCAYQAYCNMRIVHIVYILDKKSIITVFIVYCHYCWVPHPRAQLFMYHHLQP